MINILQRTSPTVLHTDPQLISPEQTRALCEFTFMKDHSLVRYVHIHTKMWILFSSFSRKISSFFLHNKITHSNVNNIHFNNSCKQILHTHTNVFTPLPEITAKIGYDVGVFTILHHYDLLLNDSKVLTCKQNVHRQRLTMNSLFPLSLGYTLNVFVVMGKKSNKRRKAAKGRERLKEEYKING